MQAWRQYAESQLRHWHLSTSAAKPGSAKTACPTQQLTWRSALSASRRLKAHMPLAFLPTQRDGASRHRLRLTLTASSGLAVDAALGSCAQLVAAAPVFFSPCEALGCTPLRLTRSSCATHSLSPRCTTHPPAAKWTHPCGLALCSRRRSGCGTAGGSAECVVAIVVLPAAAAAAVEEMCEVEAPACAVDELAIDAGAESASDV